MTRINELNALSAWIKAIQHITDKGETFLDNDKRQCQEVQNLSITIQEPQTINKPLDLLQRTNKWIYPSKEELSNIMFKEQPAPIYEYTYGGRIFSYKNLNQIEEFIIPLLTKDPFSRRAVISVYDPNTDSCVLNKNTPGMILIQLLIRKNQLNLYAVIRSNDIFFGFPANSYQLYCLQDYLAKKLKTKIGTLTINSISAHIFLEDKTTIKELLTLNQ